MGYCKLTGQQFYNMIINGSNRLEEQKDYVNALNVFPVPDGDTGTNMSMTFRSAAQEIQKNKLDGIGELSRKLSRGALMGARGNSGVILSQIFRGIAKGLEGKVEVTSEEFANAILEGAKSAYKAVMRPTEGTILTVIRAAGEAAVNFEGDDIIELMRVVCEQSEITVNKTPDMNPVLKKANVVDSGGVGLLIILKGMREALENNLSDLSIVTESVASIEVNGAKNLGEDHEIQFGYCTEFIILSNGNNSETFKSEIVTLGDSVVVVGMDDIIKVHIHTNDPGLVLSKAVKFGELSRIKIDNMREEHRSVLEGDYSLAGGGTREVPKSEEEEAKEYGFISVALGEGIKNVFVDLGVDEVIEGGQTMNPSTQDILKAVENINAKNIFILPNNKNIIMAAEQAVELSEKNLVVIKTKNIPQGITALTEFNPENTLEQNIKDMNLGISSVTSAAVTYAVRDTEMDGKDIKEGDILGLIEGKIQDVGKDYMSVCKNLISNMVSDDSSFISIFYGKDINEDEMEGLVSELEEKYSNLDIQSLPGKQPLYYFILSVE